ncbi:hypothetical protein Salat_2693800 [Sesamum alatum]|uniref:Uncharacterized protein n=1 Tax=Sesamum alatum TaxID=300844 RepID=A0AAE2CBA1_9LAMI|nr:hypothetical protein Salat_2693800 [Sesamum alatum]
MGRIQESHDRKEVADGEALKIWDCGSPLYDSYELVAVSNVIERHLMELPYLNAGSSRKMANERGISPSLMSLPVKPAANGLASKNGRKLSVLSFLSGLVWKRKMEGKKQKTGSSMVSDQCMIISDPRKK